MSVQQYGTIIEQVAITATSGGITTLTNISKELQIFNGSANQTVVLPVATSYTKPGAKFEIYNLSTGSIQVQHQDSSAIQTISANSTLIVKLIDNTTANGTWVTLTNSTVPAVNAPTVQKFLSTGTQTGTLFDISAPASNVSVGAVYTNNSNSFTVQNAVTTSQSGYVLYCNGAGTTSGSTLTLSSGTGPSTLTFSATQALATYTTPSGPTPLYLKVRMVGGGGGGGGGTNGGSGAGGNGGNGTLSTFGNALLIAAPGSGGLNGDTATGGTGGTLASSSLGGFLGMVFPGGAGDPGSGSLSEPGTGIDSAGGSGACSPFGGAGGGGASTFDGTYSGTNAGANTGSGGGGGGAGDEGSSYQATGGGGGGAGAYVEAIITAPSGSYTYSIGSGGSAGTAGPSGQAGGTGAAGFIIVEEHYQ